MCKEWFLLGVFRITEREKKMFRLVGKRGKGFYESLLVAATVLPVVALAMTYPPYEIYTGTTTGNPQLTYTKVCEPGRTGEGNASYVILGSY